VRVRVQALRGPAAVRGEAAVPALEVEAVVVVAERVAAQARAVVVEEAEAPVPPAVRTGSAEAVPAPAARSRRASR